MPVRFDHPYTGRILIAPSSISAPTISDDVTLIDGYIAESHTARVTKSKYPVESGGERTEHRRVNPIRLQIVGIIEGGATAVTDIQVATPLGEESSLGTRGPTPRQSAQSWKSLIDAMNEQVSLQVVTAIAHYDGMTITKANPYQNSDIALGSLAVDIELEEDQRAVVREQVARVTKVVNAVDTPAALTGAAVVPGLDPSLSLFTQARLVGRIRSEAGAELDAIGRTEVGLERLPREDDPSYRRRLLDAVDEGKVVWYTKRYEEDHGQGYAATLSDSEVSDIVDRFNAGDILGETDQARAIQRKLAQVQVRQDLSEPTGITMQRLGITSIPSQTMSVRLGRGTYAVSLTYQLSDGAWYIDISDVFGTNVLSGRKVVPYVPLIHNSALGGNLICLPIGLKSNTEALPLNAFAEGYELVFLTFDELRGL